MNLDKFADLHSNQLGNHLNNNEKVAGNLLLKNWKNHGILSIRKSGKPVLTGFTNFQETLHLV